MAVAKFFVFAVLGADYDQSPYTQTGDRVAELAARGIRLVVEEFRTDVTKTRKDGSRGALRIDYGDPRKPEKPITWLWKFIVCRAAGYAEMCWRCPDSVELKHGSLRITTDKKSRPDIGSGRPHAPSEPDSTLCCFVATADRRRRIGRAMVPSVRADPPDVLWARRQILTLRAAELGQLGPSRCSRAGQDRDPACRRPPRSRRQGGLG
jgi:hypothetical protein